MSAARRISPTVAQHTIHTIYLFPICRSCHKNDLSVLSPQGLFVFILTTEGDNVKIFSSMHRSAEGTVHRGKDIQNRQRDWQQPGTFSFSS